MEKTENEGGLFIKASRKLDHYLLKPTLEKLLNRGEELMASAEFLVKL